MADATPGYDEARRAADAIASHGGPTPRVAIVLGSGLDAAAERVEQPLTISYDAIPHFPVPTVAGHSGQLVLGTLGGVSVAVLRGRAHFYEGNTPQAVALPVRALRLLGAETLVLTNAAGGLNPALKAGDLLLLDDHIGLPVMAGHTPLSGPNDERFGPRFPAMTDAYDAVLRQIARQVAQEQGIALPSGVYVMAAGPSYETPAELRFMRMIGGDAVGMSTVFETIAARHMGMRVLGISCVTNSASPDKPQEIEQDHAAVIAAAASASERLADLLVGIMRRL